ncbi:hypothetical protein JMK10_13430 [Rhodovulum sulfidophilum]|uniref:hypothetical protein n=1 Tax=Rhodovulum sulfidophilum TaxID=35806 RepID=UPI00192394A7|nr:hypothetical protein [Rhodovulum sulfidophilum]MBL3575005.1 hypothetical protein [Rhodovulum sulfidophilum]MCE8430584.1 hypothetical protein [Rhodovulum sulfidophilum]MCF4117790.1 hypothetical protein [Rhodovulum sulfidophilum]
MRPLFDRRAGRARTALAERTGACLATLRVFARDWDTAFAETAEGVLFELFRGGWRGAPGGRSLPGARSPHRF